MIDKNGLEAIGDIVETIATAEGLHAHAQSVKIRRECKGNNDKKFGYLENILFLNKVAIICSNICQSR